MVAWAGTDAEQIDVELALVGHTDTVPFDAGWAEALSLTERGGRLYGRGACDTKGFIAAALAAAEGAELRRLKRPLALVFTADEEVGCLGAKRLAEARPLSARYSVVGEPTSLRPMRAGKGYCLADVVVYGREGHSAYRRSARTPSSAPPASSPRGGHRLELHRNARPEFEPPHTTLKRRPIRGGTARTSSPAMPLHARMAARAGSGASHVVELVRAAAETRRRATRLRLRGYVIRLDEATETPAESALVRLLEETTQSRRNHRLRDRGPADGRAGCKRPSSSARRTYASRTAGRVRARRRAARVRPRPLARRRAFLLLILRTTRGRREASCNLVPEFSRSRIVMIRLNSPPPLALTLLAVARRAPSRRTRRDEQELVRLVNNCRSSRRSATSSR